MVILVFTCRVSLDNPFAWCGTLDDLFVVCPRNKSRPVGQAASGLGARGPLPLPGHVSPPLGSVAKDPRTTWSCIQLSGRRGSDSGHGSSHCSGMNWLGSRQRLHGLLWTFLSVSNSCLSCRLYLKSDHLSSSTDAPCSTPPSYLCSLDPSFSASQGDLLKT